MKTDFNLKLYEPESNHDQKRQILKATNYIEEYFESLDINLKVVQIYNNPEGLEFRCKIPVGVTIEHFQKHEKPLGEILSAPRKKVDIQAPMPGLDLVGITLPWVFPFADIPNIETPIPISETFADHWRTKLSVKMFRLAEKISGSILCQSIG